MIGKTYRLGSNIRAFLAFFTIMFVVMAGTIFVTMVRQGWPLDGVILVVWLAFALIFFGVMAGRGIIAITIHGDTVVFRSLLRTVRMPVGELRTIETSWWDLNLWANVTSGISAAQRSFP